MKARNFLLIPLCTLMVAAPFKSSAGSWRSKMQYTSYAKKEFTLFYTQDELTTALKMAFEGDKSNAVDRNTINVKVAESGVYVSGRVLKPVNGTLTLGLNGSIQDGLIIPHLTYVKFGFLRLPTGFMERQILSRLPPDWQKSINLKDVEWTEGKLETGKVTLKGRMKRKIR